MITTGSKFFYALAGVLFVTAVVYGYVTGGGEVGPLSAGYKGAVGDLVGYSILLGGAAIALFVALASTAFRDAEPDATARLLDAPAPPPPSVPSTSYWPIVGAFGVGLTVVGVVLNNVFFVAGLIALGAVAIEWTMQAWSERATGDPAVNREIRNRVMYPLEVPIAGALAIAVVVLGYSRVFLAVSAAGAVWVALAVAAIVFAVGTILSTQSRIRSDVIAGLLAVGAVVTIGLGIFGAIAGERDFEHHGEESEHSDDAEAGQEGVGAGALEESN